MKKFFSALVVLLVLTLTSGAAFSQGETKLNEKEIAVAGSVPSSWGSLTFVMPGPKENQMRLFFEDERGVVRIVNLSNVEAMGPDIYTLTWGNVLVIKRSK